MIEQNTECGCDKLYLWTQRIVIVCALIPANAYATKQIMSMHAYVIKRVTNGI